MQLALLLALVASLGTAEYSSMFLSSQQVADVAKGVASMKCPFTILEPAKPLRTDALIVNVTDFLHQLSTRAYVTNSSKVGDPKLLPHRARFRELDQLRDPVTIGAESIYKDSIVKMAPQWKTLITLVLFDIKTVDDVFCAEAIMLSNRIDLVLLMTVRLQSRIKENINIFGIEHRIGKPIVMPAKAIVDKFNSEYRFAMFLANNGLSKFTTELYTSLSKAVFPCIVVDRRQELGISIANSSSAVRQVMTKFNLKGTEIVLMQHLKTGSVFSMYFVAHRGVLLSAFCAKPPDTRDAVSRDFNCDGAQEQSMLPSLVASIIHKSGYDGFGCIDLRFVDSHNTPYDRQALKHIIGLKDYGDPSALTATYGGIPGLDDFGFATPRPVIIGWSTGLCQSVLQRPANFRAMLYTYMHHL